MKVVLPHKEELELHHNMLSSCSQKVTTINPFFPCSLFPVQENNKLASSEMPICFLRYVPVLVRLGSRQSSHLAIKWGVEDKSKKNKMRKICFCPEKHCTMGLQCQLESEKIIKRKWLDFTHFSTNCYFFGLYWYENANI